MTHRKDAIAGTILLLLVMALNTSAAWATKRVATDACPAPAVADARFREAITILCLVNRERTTRGLTAVRVSQQLSQSALANLDLALKMFDMQSAEEDIAPPHFAFHTWGHEVEM